MDSETRMASFHLVEGTSVSSGGRALTELLRALPGGGPLAALAGAVQPATDALYRLVASNRSRLGPLIPAEVKSRADATIERRRAAKAGL